MPQRTVSPRPKTLSHFERCKVMAGHTNVSLGALSGLHRNTIARLSRGAVPSLRTAIRVAEALLGAGADVRALFPDSDFSASPPSRSAGGEGGGTAPPPANPQPTGKD